MNNLLKISLFVVLALQSCIQEKAEPKKEIKTSRSKRLKDLDSHPKVVFDWAVNSSRFKLESKTDSVYRFTLDGVERKLDSMSTFIEVVAMPNDGRTPRKVSLKINDIVQRGGAGLLLEENSTDKINGYDAFEAYYKGYEIRGEFRFYSLVLSNREGTVQIQGRSVGDYDMILEEMKKFAHSISF